VITYIRSSPQAEEDGIVFHPCDLSFTLKVHRRIVVTQLGPPVHSVPLQLGDLSCTF
jgi:hypothetical protein